LVSIVVPVFKSTASLRIIAEQVDELQTKSGQSLELIFINDSPQFIPTVNALKDIKENYHFVKVYSMRRNQGQHIATMVGLSKASGLYIVTMDDDLQHPVGEVPRLIEALESDPVIDAVFAVPDFKSRHHRLFRNIVSRIFSSIDGVFQTKPKGLLKSSFRILRNDLAEILLRSYFARPAISGMIIDKTHNIINIEVKHNKCVSGKSNYSFMNLFDLAVNNILYYSSLPLRLIGALGYIATITSVVSSIILLCRMWLTGSEIPVESYLILLTGFFGGIISIGLSIIGEYLLRILLGQQKPELDDLISRER